MQPPRKRFSLFRLIAYAAVGAALGGLINPGLSVLFAFVCAIFSLPEISPMRIFGLTIAAIITRNIHGTGLMERADAATPIPSAEVGPDGKTTSERFQDWVLGEGLQRRGGRYVLGGIIIAAMIGSGICVRDFIEIGNGKLPWVLDPDPNEPNVIYLSAVAVILGFAVWGGTLVGLVVSPTFRRPLGVALLFSGAISACILTGAPSRRALFGVIFAMTTFGAFPALLVPLLMEFVEDDDSESDSSEND